MPIKADLGGKFQLTDLISPDTDADAATKGYVDEHESGATRYVAINSTGDSADAPGTDAIAIGERTTAAGDDSITIGTQNNGVGGVDPAALLLVTVLQQINRTSLYSVMKILATSKLRALRQILIPIIVMYLLTLTVIGNLGLVVEEVLTLLLLILQSLVMVLLASL